MGLALIARRENAFRVQFRNPAREAFVYFEGNTNTTFGADLCRVPPLSSNERHSHEDADEIIYVIAGEMRIVLEADSHVLRQADAVIVFKGQEHHIFNNSATEDLLHSFTFSPPGPATAIRNGYGRSPDSVAGGIVEPSQAAPEEQRASR
jgi:quercetin dioxygenase-like cupin family protein